MPKIHYRLTTHKDPLLLPPLLLKILIALV